MDAQQLEARQAQLLELEATFVRVCSAARYEIQQAADELRQAQAELHHRQINIRTEQQIADELHCHVDSMRRTRKKLNLSYTRSPGGTILYTEEQYLALLAARESPVKLKKAP
jgi:hypothetical protein